VGSLVLNYVLKSCWPVCLQSNWIGTTNYLSFAFSAPW